ncbi:MAG: (d)CMP kinase [Gammaproteobacteria bacterium]
MKPVDLPSVLTIDGPSGSGKGTISRRAAEMLGWHLLDSGALYRLLVHAAFLAEVPSDDATRLGSLARGLKVDFQQTPAGVERILLDGQDVTRAVRSEECGARASQLAVLPEVRTGLQALQRRFRQLPGLVADGRDMGTVIFPDAGLKIYLTASVAERAQRRYNQLKEKGFDANLHALLQDIAARDERDQSRSISPLKPADDAILVDTTGRSIQQVVETVMSLARQRFIEQR